MLVKTTEAGAGIRDRYAPCHVSCEPPDSDAEEDQSTAPATATRRR